MITEGMPGTGPDNLIITHGSTQGMHLAAQVFVDREDVVFVGLPTYFGGPGAVRSRSGHNTLRLSYAQAGHRDIEYAIRKIGNLMKAHIVGRKTNNAA